MAALRLNLGCGSTVVPGWVNIDRSPGPLLDRVPLVKKTLFHLGVISPDHMTAWPRGIVRLDIRKRLPYADGTVDAVYSSHTLEHLYLDEARSVLKEVHRVLRSGGLVRLALPDTEVLAREFVRELDTDPVGASLQFNAGLLAHPTERPPMRARLAVAMGANVHRWQPTRALVASMLRDAGFDTVHEKEFRESSLTDIAAIEHRKNSFFLEAVKSAAS